MNGWKRRRRSAVLGAVVVMLMATSCGGGSSDAGNGDGASATAAAASGGAGAGAAYPAEVRSNFLNSCTSSAASASGDDPAAFEDLCLCVLEAIEADMTLEQFTAAEQAMMSGEASKIDMRTLIQGCVA